MNNSNQSSGPSSQPAQQQGVDAIKQFDEAQLKKEMEELRGTIVRQDNKLKDVQIKLQNLTNNYVDSGPANKRKQRVKDVIKKLASKGVLNVSEQTNAQGDVIVVIGENPFSIATQDQLKQITDLDVSRSDNQDIYRALGPMSTTEIKELAKAAAAFLVDVRGDLLAVVTAYKATLKPGADVSAIISNLPPHVKDALDKIMNSTAFQKLFKHMDNPSSTSPGGFNVDNIGAKLNDIAGQYAPFLMKIMTVVNRFREMFDDIKRSVKGEACKHDAGIDRDIASMSASKTLDTKQRSRLTEYKKVSLKEYSSSKAQIKKNVNLIGDAELKIKDPKTNDQEKKDLQSTIETLKLSNQEIEKRMTYLKGRLDDINKLIGGNTIDDLENLDKQRVKDVKLMSGEIHSLPWRMGICIVTYKPPEGFEVGGNVTYNEYDRLVVGHVGTEMNSELAKALVEIGAKKRDQEYIFDVPTKELTEKVRDIIKKIARDVAIKRVENSNVKTLDSSEKKGAVAAMKKPGKWVGPFASQAPEAGSNPNKYDYIEIDGEIYAQSTTGHKLYKYSYRIADGGKDNGYDFKILDNMCLDVEAGKPVKRPEGEFAKYDSKSRTWSQPDTEAIEKIYETRERKGQSFIKGLSGDPEYDDVTNGVFMVDIKGGLTGAETDDLVLEFTDNEWYWGEQDDGAIYSTSEFYSSDTGQEHWNSDGKSQVKKVIDGLDAINKDK